MLIYLSFNINAVLFQKLTAYLSKCALSLNNSLVKICENRKSQSYIGNKTTLTEKHKEKSLNSRHNFSIERRCVWQKLPPSNVRLHQLLSLNGINENRELHFEESTVNNNQEEQTQDGQTWTFACIEHLVGFISGDLNICCQNFACNTAVRRCQHNHKQISVIESRLRNWTASSNYAHGVSVLCYSTASSILVCQVELSSERSLVTRLPRRTAC
jgi:hypothetical protein